MNKHKGSSVENFLESEELLNEAEAIAIKRVIAYQIEQAMAKSNISKSAMAEKMRTSRTALNRLLDPDNTAVTLGTLIKAAKILGRKLQVSIK